MPKYKVINTFKDLQHRGLLYNIGDIYPAEGQQLVESRVEELTMIHPTYGVAFLKVVEEDIKTSQTPKKTTQSTSKTAKKEPKNTGNSAKTVGKSDE